MNKKIRKYGLLIIAFLICAFLNYNPQLLFESGYRHWGWNSALIATVSILVIFRLRDPLEWKQKLGIDFKRADWVGFCITTISLLIISYFIVNNFSEINGYSFRPKIFYYKDFVPPDFPFFPILGDYLYYFPQTFNEEIFIGALLLMGIQRYFMKLDKTIIAIGVALIFSLMHQALYKWSPVQPDLLLSLQTIFSLFFVGILRNVLILKTRKIAYSWAIHLSYNMVFFSGFFINNMTTEFASEAERFNIVFGNMIMVITTGLLALASLIWLNINVSGNHLQKLPASERV